MTIRSRPYFWVECNCCEESVDYGDNGYAAWMVEQAVQAARDAADFQTVEVDGVEQQLCPNCWVWPEDVPGYDEATSTSDDPVQKHEQHPTKGGVVDDERG